MSGENRKIWIGNVPATMTEFQLLQLCRREGHLTSFQPFIGGNRPSSYSTRGFAFAEYSTMAEATEAAKNLRGRVINGCRLRCQFARETTSQGKNDSKKIEVPSVLKIQSVSPTNFISKDEKQRKIQAIEEKLQKLKNS